MVNKGIFREYDIRGIVGKEINKDTAFSIGRVLASFIKKKKGTAKRLSVGRDVRTSSEYLAEGVTEGVISAGIDVYDIGICSTPLQYFSLFHLDLDGGIMVTGSHNPPEYNGFKLSVGKETIYGRDIHEIRDLILNEEYISADERGSVHKYDIATAYSNYMLNEFSYLKDSRFRSLTVVVDAGNGTAGITVPDLVNKLGCKVIPLYCEPDGKFPNHHPDPTVVENMQDLIRETRRNEADIGIGYDGDADRIGVISEDGDIIWGDQLMIILSRDLLGKHPGAIIIGDVKCSQVMFDDIKNHGGNPIMWKTGHSLVKNKMRNEGALLAGEFSGHIFIGDRYFGYDDAIYTTLRLIEIMKSTGMGIKELLSDMPKMFYTPEIRMDCPDDKKKDVVERVVAKFEGYKADGNSPYKIRSISTIDGVRVVFEKGWGLIRASNTQPVVVMRVEASDNSSLNEYKTFIEGQFQEEIAT